MESGVNLLIGAGIIAISIVFSAVIFKYIEIYEKWIASNKEAQYTLEQITFFIEILELRNNQNNTEA